MIKGDGPKDLRGSQGLMRPGRLLLAAVTLVLALPAAQAQSQSAEAEIFRAVCLQNAPELSEAAIRAGVASTSYKGGDVLTSAGLQFEPGRSCKVVFTVPGEPSDAEIQALAGDLATRIGGTVTQKKSVIGGGIWYEVRVGREKFGVDGGWSGNAKFFMLTRR